MADTPAKPRRLPRYSLRTLFVVVTVLCVGLGWNFNVVHHRQRLLAWTDQHHGRPEPLAAVRARQSILNEVHANTVWEDQFNNTPSVSFVRRLLGDESIALFSFAASPPANMRAELQYWFPESMFDYEAPGVSFEFSTFTDQAEFEPDRFAFPTLAPLNGQ